MAESVDALVSNTSGATHPGSTPGLGTKKTCKLTGFLFFVRIRCHGWNPRFGCMERVLPRNLLTNAELNEPISHAARAGNPEVRRWC